MIKNDIQTIARSLEQAEKTCQQIDPVSLAYPEINMQQAYEIQQTWVDHKIDAGQKVIGYKIGLTSRTMQRAMNIDVPDYGVLLDKMHFANKSALSAEKFCDPRIEAEIAFVLKKGLSGDELTIEDVFAATDYVTPALELIDARSYRVHPETGYKRKVFDTIADNAANAGVILADGKFDPWETDLRWWGAILSRNNIVEETGLAAGVLNHPAQGIIEVAKMFSQHNIKFKPGHIILSGSFTSPVCVKAGDKIVADYGSWGQVKCYFV